MSSSRVPAHRESIVRHAADVFHCVARKAGYVSFIYLTWSLFDILIRAKDDTLKPYIDAARWIPLAIHPFASISSFIYSGIADLDQMVQVDEEELMYSDFFITCALLIFFLRYDVNDVWMNNETMKLVPCFQDLILEFKAAPEKLRPFVSLVSAAPILPSNLC